MNQRTPYPTDLIDAEWTILEPLIPKPKNGPRGGRPPKERREIVNGIRYVTRTGCAWRLMPHDLPNWGTCYFYFRQWKLDGIWERINAKLRGDVRVKAGRDRQPSAAIIDEYSGPNRSVIPLQADHPFQSKPISDSRDADHLIR